ncbi:MAG: hypothetical protein IPK20_12460 [Betaproteobacteria bacterium]|nr:hypothetical protein [Betaproteobacteria bacterium]
MLAELSMSSRRSSPLGLRRASKLHRQQALHRAPGECILAESVLSRDEHQTAAVVANEPLEMAARIAGEPRRRDVVEHDRVGAAQTRFRISRELRRRNALDFHALRCECLGEVSRADRLALHLQHAQAGSDPHAALPGIPRFAARSQQDLDLPGASSLESKVDGNLVVSRDEIHTTIEQGLPG